MGSFVSLLTLCQQSRPNKKKDFKNQYFATHGFDCNDISFVPVCLDIWICVVNQRRRIHIIISFQLPSNIQIFWPILNDGADDCTKFLLCRSQGKTVLDREECLHIKLLCTYLHETSNSNLDIVHKSAIPFLFTISNVICLVNPQNESWVLFIISRNSLYQGLLYRGLSVPTNPLTFKY